jgi:hypothetical protein
MTRMMPCPEQKFKYNYTMAKRRRTNNTMAKRKTTK